MKDVPVKPAPLLVNATDAAAMLGMSRSFFYSQVALGRIMEPLRYGKKSLWSTESLAAMVREEVKRMEGTA